MQEEVLREHASQHQNGMAQEDVPTQKRTAYVSSRRLVDDSTQETSLRESLAERDRLGPLQHSPACLTQAPSEAQKNSAMPIHVTTIDEHDHTLFFLRLEDALSAHMIEVRSPFFVQIA